MKRLLFLILMICCACDSWQTQIGKHSVSGVISDMDGTQERLMTGVQAVVTNSVGKRVYSGDVIPEGTVGGSYSIDGIPQGKYEIVFQGKYYKPSAYVISVSGDTDLDVELEPIYTMMVEQDEIRFEPRVNEQTLTIRNLSETAMNFGIRADLPMGNLMFLEISAKILSSSCFCAASRRAISFFVSTTPAGSINTVEPVDD